MRGVDTLRRKRRRSRRRRRRKRSRRRRRGGSRRRWRNRSLVVRSIWSGRRRDWRNPAPPLSLSGPPRPGEEEVLHGYLMRISAFV